MFTLKINKAEKIHVIATGEDMISVEYQIMDQEGTVVKLQAQGFPLTATNDDIASEMAKHLDSYIAWAERSKELEKVAEVNKSADEVIAKINSDTDSAK